MNPPVRKRFLLVSVVIVLAILGAVILLANRNSRSRLVAAGERQVTPDTPVALDAPVRTSKAGAAPAQGDMPTTVPWSSFPEPGVAVLEGVLVKAEDGNVLSGVKLSLNFRDGDDAGKNVSVLTNDEGGFTVRFESATALPLHGGWFERRDLVVRRFVFEDPARAQ